MNPSHPFASASLSCSTRASGSRWLVGTMAVVLAAVAAPGCLSDTSGALDLASNHGPPTQEALSKAQRAACRGSSLKKGQKQIDRGRLEAAIVTFSCVIDDDPLALDGYRGRAEAKLLSGRYSDAMRDYALVTAVVMPERSDAPDAILSSYDARLAEDGDDIAALTGASFAHWWYFDYATALSLLDELALLEPNDLYGVLYRGSSRLFVGDDIPGGVADFERAIELAPGSRDVRFIVADGYTYAYPDAARARQEAMLALAWGLDTPRIHAILASAAFAQGDEAAGAKHLKRHVKLVTTELVATPPLAVGASMLLDFVAGRTFQIPIHATNGQPLSIRTTSPSGAIYDSVVVLTGPGGAAVIGNDDFVDYFAGFDWTPAKTGVYTLNVTTFEGVGTGDLEVSSE